MAVNRPTLAQLNAQAQSDQTSRISNLSPALRRSLFGAIATAIAGIAHGLYGFVVRKSADYTPFTARADALDGWMGLYKLPRKAATASSGSILVSASAGATVSAASQLTSGAGIPYTTGPAVQIGNSGVASVTVTADSAGSSTNLPAGAPLTFVSPDQGVQGNATVDANGLTGGADLETDDEALARLILRLSNAPQGGSQTDYVEWALQVPNIDRAWCFPTYAGPGTVRVYVSDDSYQGATLASPADVAAVQAYIETKKPCGVATTDGNGNVIDGLTVLAPTTTATPITSTVVPNTPIVQASVQTNLTALFATAAPEAGFSLHQIYKAFLDADGLTDFNLIAPAVAPQAAAGCVLKLGTVTFQ